MSFSLSKEIIYWWEKKRITYNLFSIGTGLLCLIFLYFLSLYLNHPIYFFFLLPFAILYLVFLNIIYTLGWLIHEMLLSRKNYLKLDTVNKRYITYYFLCILTVQFNIFCVLLLIILLGIFC